jgi:hypothetical protein
MKTKLFFTGSMVLFLTSCSTQLKTDQVPSVVDNTVKAKFSGAGDIEWKKTGPAYEADFKIGTLEHTAEIDSTGKLLRYKIDILPADLPPAILQSLEKSYKGMKVDDVEKLDIVGVVYYQVELENKPKDIELVFLPDGTLSGNTIYWD